MTKLLIAVAVLATFAAATSSSKAQARPSGECPGLRQQYSADVDLASRYAALNQALGNNASAANAAKESNALSRARLALDALRTAGCRPTPLLPSAKRYMPAANRCKLDSIMSRFGGERPDTCDPTKWQRAKP